MPYSHQASIGVERQFGASMSFQSNVVYTGGRNEEFDPNINLNYDPCTGATYNNSDASRRPLSQFGPVQMSPLQRPVELLRVGERVHAPHDQSTCRRRSPTRCPQFKDATHVPWQWYIENGHSAAQDLGFAPRRHGRGVHGWRQPISGIAPSSTASGKRHTDCS
jgi:hypothetical protein